MPVEATKQAYSRQEVCRLLGVSARRLKNWEKHGFFPVADYFDFSDLLSLKALLRLTAGRIPLAEIKKALASIRKRTGSAGSLTELKIYSHGKRLEVQFAGKKMEPVSGQLLIDFDAAEMKRLLAFPPKVAEPQHKQRREAEQWFEKGLELENTGGRPDDIIEAYQKACALDPQSAGALVNLGTVYFNLRRWRDAERNYRKALEVDPNYALAHYNLGNLFDEQGDRAKALGHYESAIRIHANYADAHYNIALIYQSLGQPLKAVRHWKVYLKLDPQSNWAEIARRELGKLRDVTIVRGNRPIS